MVYLRSCSHLIGIAWDQRVHSRQKVFVRQNVFYLIDMSNQNAPQLGEKQNPHLSKIQLPSGDWWYHNFLFIESGHWWCWCQFLFACHSHQINLIINKGIEISRDATLKYFVLLNLNRSSIRCILLEEKFQPRINYIWIFSEDGSVTNKFLTSTNSQLQSRTQMSCRTGLSCACRQPSWNHRIF